MGRLWEKNRSCRHQPTPTAYQIQRCRHGTAPVRRTGNCSYISMHYTESQCGTSRTVSIVDTGGQQIRRKIQKSEIFEAAKGEFNFY